MGTFLFFRMNRSLIIWDTLTIAAFYSALLLILWVEYGILDEFMEFNFIRLFRFVSFVCGFFFLLKLSQFYICIL